MAGFHSPARSLTRGHPGAGIAAAGTIVAAAAVLGTVVVMANRGFDLTDEAYYLLSIEVPAAYRMTSTLFGYALHPLHVLLGGSVTALRIFGLAVLAAFGAAAAGLFLTSRRAPGEALPALSRAAVVAAGAALPAMYYGFWLPTPSYNLLVLAAALLLLPAIVLLADRTRGPSLPAALAALAGLIAAMAKPPAAAAFAALYLAATVLQLREPRRIGIQLAFAFGFTAAGVAALAALLPLETVWAQTRGYIEMHGAAPPAGRGAMADLLVFLVHPRGWPFVAALIAAALAAQAERSGWSERTRRRIAGLALAAVAAAAALIVGFPVYPALGPGMAAIAFAAIALGLLGGTDRRSAFALALAALLPLAAAIGTTNDTVSQTSLYAGVLGLVALAAAMAARRNGAVAVVALCLVLVTGSAVWKGLAKPYRLAAPIWRQTEPVEIGTRGERLKLDPGAAAFVRSLRDGAKRRGFCNGDPVIDLSGELPGIAVLLGGGAPGFPWLFGGYPFSERLAGWILSGVDPQTRGRAWLVIAEGRIAFSAAFVASLGFDLAGAYDLAFDGSHPLYGTPVRLYRPRAAAGVPCGR
ncbi:MAG: hypothetical protein ACJ8DN_10485 [Microvirga sp.]